MLRLRKTSTCLIKNIDFFRVEIGKQTGIKKQDVQRRTWT